jgi:hypothetical protein
MTEIITYIDAYSETGKKVSLRMIMEGVDNKEVYEIRVQDIPPDTFRITFTNEFKGKL